MMTSDMRRSLPTTYADLIERGYNIHFIRDNSAEIHIFTGPLISHESAYVYS